MNRLMKMRIYLILIVVLAAAILGVVIFGLRGCTGESSVPAPTATTPPVIRTEIREVEKEVEKIVEVEKQITPEIIQDGLNDIGILITEEYYFTEVVTFSSEKTLKTFWKSEIKLPGTESGYIISYDGIVNAGIDFGAVAVEKDEGAQAFTIHIPKAEIRNVDIDPESFTLYSEKNSMLNPTSVTDYNASLTQLEANARTKAIDRGLLTRADENAKTVIRNFMAGMVDTSAYSLNFVTG